MKIRMVRLKNGCAVEFDGSTAHSLVVTQAPDLRFEAGFIVWTDKQDCVHRVPVGNVLDIVCEPEGPEGKAKPKAA